MRGYAYEIVGYRSSSISDHYFAEWSWVRNSLATALQQARSWLESGGPFRTLGTTDVLVIEHQVLANYGTPEAETNETGYAVRLGAGERRWQPVDASGVWRPSYYGQ